MRWYRILTIALLAGALLRWGVQYSEAADAQEKQAPPQWTAAQQQKGYVVFSHSTMDRLSSDLIPAQERIGEKVSCELAPGEYESLQIGVHGLGGGVKGVRLDVKSDLEVDVYYLHPWAIYPSTLKEEWLQPGYFAPFSTLMTGNVIDEVGENSTRAFWLTFHASPDTPAGVHQGTILIKPEEKPVTRLELEVRVRPFVLQAPRVAFGMYFRRYDGWIPQYSLTDEWLSVMYRDMAQHGQNSVTFYQGGDFSTLPPKSIMVGTLLPLAKQAGLIRADIPCMTLQTNHTGLNSEQRRAAVQWLQAECQERGWPELLLYGRDEPSYPMPELRETYASWRDVPMRVVTALGAQPAYGHGDLHDVWVVYGGHITPEMRAEAQRLGAEVWTYSCHMSGGRPSYRHRYFAGLYTWAHKLGGNWLWAYHWLVWWRSTDREPLPTVSWECRREGIDDYRYLQMLEDCVAANPGDLLAAEAGGWLEALRARITTDPHQVEPGRPFQLEEYDRIRAKAADYIQRLGPVREDQIPRRRVTGLKDEAALFRGKSVEQCLEGLRSPDASVRRAAAWALFERGPEAAAATQALANALADPEVRMPALRALEAIGPAIYYPATPKIAALLRHPDGFVRLGATFVLGAIGPTAVEPLRVALKDDFPPVAYEAGKALARLGPVAEAALPEAMELLGRPSRSPGSTYYGAALMLIDALGPAKVVNYLRAMGVKGKPVEGLVRELLTFEEVAEELKGGLQEFLKELEAGKQPEPVMP